jgi:hypothetical protein
VDRVAGDQFLKVFPDIAVVARATRAFMGRAVRYLAAEEGVRQFLDIGTAQQEYNKSGAAPYCLRGPDQIAAFFDGLELVQPGLVSCSLWRPEPTAFGLPPEVDALAGVARNPSLFPRFLAAHIRALRARAAHQDVDIHSSNPQREIP